MSLSSDDRWRACGARDRAIGERHGLTLCGRRARGPRARRPSTHVRPRQAEPPSMGVEHPFPLGCARCGACAQECARAAPSAPVIFWLLRCRLASPGSPMVEALASMDRPSPMPRRGSVHVIPLSDRRAGIERPHDVAPQGRSDVAAWVQARPGLLPLRPTRQRGLPRRSLGRRACMDGVRCSKRPSSLERALRRLSARAARACRRNAGRGARLRRRSAGGRGAAAWGADEHQKRPCRSIARGRAGSGAPFAQKKPHDVRQGRKQADRPSDACGSTRRSPGGCRSTSSIP